MESRLAAGLVIFSIVDPAPDQKPKQVVVFQTGSGVPRAENNWEVGQVPNNNTGTCWHP